MNKGAVWLGSGNKKKRIRRAKKKLVPGDLVSIYYSKKVQEKVPVKPTLLDDRMIFSVWEKPAGLMSGGSRFGDHCSINRAVEKQLGRTTLLVHRLDLYVWGLMVFAHSKAAASHLSKQFQGVFLNLPMLFSLPRERHYVHSLYPPLLKSQALYQTVPFPA